MGLFDKLFGRSPKQPREVTGDYKLLTGYTPVFSSGPAHIYESQLIRSAINARAVHVSKLRVTFEGHGSQYLTERLKRPNAMQTWSQFLYRVSTILDVDNNVIIVPVFDRLNRVRELYPVLPSRAKLIEVKGRDDPWIAFEFSSGRFAQLPVYQVGVLTKFQYKNDYFGESNRALNPTMKVIDMNNQATVEGMRSAATFRFMASYANVAFGEDLAAEQKRFNESSMNAEKGGGILLFPSTYNNPKQIESKPFVIDADQEKQISESVYNYFCVNEDILQGRASGDKWAAFYESAIEPFAIQFSEVMTDLFRLCGELTGEAAVYATANRLQFLSNVEKLNVSSSLLDRGILSINDVRDIWNLPPVEDGDRRIIRGEYYDTNQKLSEVNDNANQE